MASDGNVVVYVEACATERDIIYENVTGLPVIIQAKKSQCDTHMLCVRLPCSNVDTHGLPYCTNEKNVCTAQKEEPEE